MGLSLGKVSYIVRALIDTQKTEEYERLKAEIEELQREVLAHSGTAPLRQFRSGGRSESIP